MINPYIKDTLQKSLDKLNYECVNNYTYNISRNENKEISIEIDNYYLIRLKSDILHPSEFSTLHINWNKNIIPKFDIYKCCVTQILGKMIRIDGVAFDIASNADLGEMLYDFWVPLNSLEIIKKL